MKHVVGHEVNSSDSYWHFIIDSDRLVSFGYNGTNCDIDMRKGKLERGKVTCSGRNMSVRFIGQL